MKLQEFFLQGLFCIFIFTGSNQVHTASVGKATDFLMPVCAWVPAIQECLTIRYPDPTCSMAPLRLYTCYWWRLSRLLWLLYEYTDRWRHWSTTLTVYEPPSIHCMEQNTSTTCYSEVWIHRLITEQCCTVLLQLSCTTDRSTNDHFEG